MPATNPPSNAALLEALSRELVGSGHDLRHVMRLIVNSRVYQLASDTTPANVADGRLHSHWYPRRLPAVSNGVGLDNLAQRFRLTTGVPARWADTGGRFVVSLPLLSDGAIIAQ